jgi:hypothetical protein
MPEIDEEFWRKKNTINRAAQYQQIQKHMDEQDSLEENAKGKMGVHNVKRESAGDSKIKNILQGKLNFPKDAHGH